MEFQMVEQMTDCCSVLKKHMRETQQAITYRHNYYVRYVYKNKNTTTRYNNNNNKTDKCEMK